MNIPNYTNTNLIINYLIKIEISLERINRTKLPRTYLDKLRSEVAISDITELSHLVNHPIGPDDAERVYFGKILPSSRSKLLVFNNYRNAQEFAKNYDKRNYMPPSAEFLKHINKITGNKIAESWDAGKMRTLTEKPVEIFDSWYKYRDYYPGLIFEDHFDEVLRLFNDPSTRIPFHIRASILMFEMIEKAPFVVTNQITTLIALSTLAKTEKKNPGLTVPYAKIINYLKDDIGSAFKLAKSRRDLTPFIEAVLYSTSLHLVELESAYQDVYENKVKKHGALNEKFNRRQVKALDYLETNKRISRDEYAKLMKVSFMTAYRDLQELVKQDYLKQEGVGRGTTYVPTKSEQIEQFKEEPISIFKDNDLNG